MADDAGVDFSEAFHAVSNEILCPKQFRLAGLGEQSRVVKTGRRHMNF